MNTLVANFFEMHRLFINMPESMLKALYDVAINNKSFGSDLNAPGLGNTSYIEAHLHGDIRFDRDIAKIVVNQTEVQESLAKTQASVKRNEPFKVRTPEEIRSTFRKFANKYGIAIEEQN
jgi:hypothetical protein